MKKCVICQEEGKDIINSCPNCKCASMHPDCYDDMLRKEINKCPTCRSEISTERPVVNISITQIINDKLKCIIESKLCYIINIIYICATLLFGLYFFLGFIACMFNNDYPNIFSLKYLEYFGILLLEISITAAFILLFYGTCCKDHADPY